MSSTFEDAFADENATDFTEHGESGTYTPPGGAGVSVTLIVDPVEASIDEGDDAQRTVKRTRMYLRTSEVASPVVRAKVTWDSIDWAVTGIPETFAGVATLEVESRDVIRKVKSGGYAQ